MRTKKITYRILIAMLMAVLLAGLSLLATAAEPAVVASGECGENLTWTLDDQGLFTISGTGPMTEYSYPETAPWLTDHSAAIKTVVIESGVTTICSRAFYACEALQSVTIPDSVIEIGYGAFLECGALTEANLPKNLTAIPDSLFRGCVALQSITIPETVTAIGGSAFFMCESLQSITIPGNVIEMGESAFASCTSLKSVTFEEGVTTTGFLTFHKCTSLENVTFPESLKVIDTSAFALCSALQNVNIPAGVSTIGSMAFYQCEALEGIWVDPENASYSSDASGVLFNKDKSMLISAPGALSGDYTIPETVTSMGSNAFSGCKKLRSVTIPESVTKIPSSAFSNSGLRSAVIPDSVTELGMYAYHNCTSLKHVVIGSGVRKIADYAFAEDTALRDIHFRGDAPVIPSSYGLCTVFTNVRANAYYPAENSTWTAAKRTNYGGELYWLKEGQTPQVTWKSATATLGGDIGLNFYVVLGENVINGENPIIRFNYGTTVIEVPLEDALVFEIEGQTQYRFTCPLNAKNMTDKVRAEILADNWYQGISVTLCVADYCNYQIQNSGNAELVSLMKAMLNYGAAAQVLFNHNTDNLANAALSEADKQLADVDASAYAHSVTGSEDGIQVANATLILETETTIRIYFNLTGSKTIDQYTFKVDGVEVEPQQNDDQYFVEIPDIAAQDLDEMHTVTVGGITVTYGGLSYVNQVLNHAGSAEALVNTVKALFAYNKMAEAYFN